MDSAATVEIRPLSECSFEDAVRIWNKGFQGYFVDMTMSLDAYLARLQREGLSPEFSMVAFSEGRPAGFLLNGIRMDAGRKVAWNGGTGVSPEFRGRGIGKALLRAAFDLYIAQGVERATLEAISENQQAISLYQQFGYEIFERLISLKREGSLSEPAFHHPDSQAYSARRVAPFDVGQLEFYQQLEPWQTHWQSLARNNGEALIVSDRNGAAVGYALFRKKRDEQERTLDIALYQCVSVPGPDAKATIACALQSVYAPLELACGRSTYNFSKGNDAVVGMLTETGFTHFIEQVHMVRTFHVL
ncbi:MAG: hypothetical protein JWM21_2190 [Acidobacteria bacterium]|nr:hypothetical protein [Acidobacteriota bacterium]